MLYILHGQVFVMKDPLPDASCQILKSQSFRSSRKRFSKDFAIYSHGGHLGHVTWTIYNKLSFPPFLRMLHMKFGFDWPSGFRGEDL